VVSSVLSGKSDVPDHRGARGLVGDLCGSAIVSMAMP